MKKTITFFIAMLFTAPVFALTGFGLGTGYGRLAINNPEVVEENSILLGAYYSLGINESFYVIGGYEINISNLTIFARHSDDPDLKETICRHPYIGAGYKAYKTEDFVFYIEAGGAYKIWELVKPRTYYTDTEEGETVQYSDDVHYKGNGAAPYIKLAVKKIRTGGMINFYYMWGDKANTAESFGISLYYHFERKE